VCGVASRFLAGIKKHQQQQHQQQQHQQQQRRRPFNDI
jgi:hypothetical protein